MREKPFTVSATSEGESQVSQVRRVVRESPPVRRAQEYVNLYRQHARDIPAQVDTVLERVRAIEDRLEGALGQSIRGQRMLDVGPGQRAPQQSYFTALGNDVIGVDRDVIPQGLNPRPYVRMARSSGLLRTAKTIGRKALRLDASFNREVCRRMGLRHAPRLRFRQMEPGALTFGDGAFDVVYSISTFQSLRDPVAALGEVARVTRRGGVAYVQLHLYTSDNGIHDPRIFADDRDDIPLWSHLRPEHAHKVRPNVYLNRLRLHEWEALFETALPGAEHVRLQPGRHRVEDKMNEIRRQGELGEYSDDELLTVDLAALWVKPPG
jgi:SAM-dependent methyltransferase